MMLPQKRAMRKKLFTDLELPIETVSDNASNLRLIKVEIDEKEDKVKEADSVEENIDDTNKQLN